MRSRFAIYYAPPPGSALERFGRSWLGRDEATDRPIRQPTVAAIPPLRLHDLTSSARHYGFHATLKAPFELAAGCSVEDLLAAAEKFAARRRPFPAPRLVVTALSHYVAFTLASPCPWMQSLADDCVRAFDCFRAPLQVVDRERRLRAHLTERQRVRLDEVGYPYVFEDFSFHMTLASDLLDAERDQVMAAIRNLAAAAMEEPLWVDAISVYQQADRDRPFIKTARLPFLGRRSS